MIVMESDVVVTIDGPAASGKSSVSRALAARMGWPWLSTGIFYRGAAYMALQQNADLSSEKQILKILKSQSWHVEMTPEKTLFFHNGVDVTNEVIKEVVGSAASQISALAAVRQALLEAQRRCETAAGLVAEGRDCGTVVFPHAAVKVYLTANPQDRARRRAKEQGLAFEEIQKAQQKRDHEDASRASAPMQVADDAEVVDTSDMDLEQVVNHVESLVKQRIPDFV